jgi:hypothetical protein
MTDDYEIPTGDTGHEPGTFLMTLVGLKPFKLYETRNGWTRELPENGAGVIDTYDKIEWAFSDEAGEIAKDSTSTSRSERSTLFAWATGLGLPAAVVLDRSKPIPSSQLIGRSANVTFTPNKNGYSRITAVVPPPKARAAAPATDPAGTFVMAGATAGLETPSAPAHDPDNLPF